jgi:(2Fe-2S) ferredoxin
MRAGGVYGILSGGFFVSGALVLTSECGPARFRKRGAYRVMKEYSIIENRDKVCALAPIAYAPIRHHIFVCSGKSCSAAGSLEVKEALTQELSVRNLLFGKEKNGKNPQGSVVLTDCSSVGFCAVGAAVMVYPDGVWYAQVEASDVAEIVEEHIVNGRIVERLMLLRVPAAGM